MGQTLHFRTLNLSSSTGVGPDGLVNDIGEEGADCRLGATNLPGENNHQIRYPLAGISEEPFSIGNARFVFLSKEEPRTGQWV